MVGLESELGRVGGGGWRAKMDWLGQGGASGAGGRLVLRKNMPVLFGLGSLTEGTVNVFLWFRAFKGEVGKHLMRWAQVC